MPAPHPVGFRQHADHMSQQVTSDLLLEYPPPSRLERHRGRHRDGSLPRAEDVDSCAGRGGRRAAPPYEF